MSSLTTQTHYENHTAQSYESAFFYEKGAYTAWLANKVQERMRLTAATTTTTEQHDDDDDDDNNSDHLQQRRMILDVGGGTGNFTKMLLDFNPHYLEAVVVDPFLADEHSDASDYRIRFVKAAAESFQNNDTTTVAAEKMWWKRGYHQILIKEVVHHLDAKDRVGIFTGMKQGTVPMALSATSGGGFPALLIVTRPQQDIDYPLWPAARQIWANHQPSFDEIKNDLERVGYSNVAQVVESYPCSIPLTRWLSMVKARFWSTFSNFTDEQLEEACDIISQNEEERIDANGNLHFEDKLIFITANL